MIKLLKTFANALILSVLVLGGELPAPMTTSLILPAS